MDRRSTTIASRALLRAELLREAGAVRSAAIRRAWDNRPTRLIMPRVPQRGQLRLARRLARRAQPTRQTGEAADLATRQNGALREIRGVAACSSRALAAPDHSGAKLGASVSWICPIAVSCIDRSR